MPKNKQESEGLKTTDPRFGSALNTLLYGVVEWINDNPKLDGMPYFITKSKAIRYAAERESSVKSLNLTSTIVKYTIIRLEKAV